GGPTRDWGGHRPAAASAQPQWRGPPSPRWRRQRRASGDRDGRGRDGWAWPLAPLHRIRAHPRPHLSYPKGGKRASGGKFERSPEGSPSPSLAVVVYPPPVSPVWSALLIAVWLAGP